MFGLGWTEMMVIGIVALIVVGPEDLPQMFRQVGKFTGKARAMAREFSKAMNDAADQSGVNEINKTIRAAANPSKFGTDQLKKATGLGPETTKLSEERKASKEKFSKIAAEKAEARKAAEAAASAPPAVEADVPAHVDHEPDPELFDHEPDPEPAPVAAEPKADRT
ncbi:Sec-independent protein translocase protein TatB [Pelagovum pacificum]|uniref:Twin-arginine translocase subunit TatB n=1 Tax=Pelagovum pacificum TaxID=2588711 RepID=A0A5C5GFN2_9RHOB|nr:Sec-independent protein translocase protein TatB [Pelagovum pacificum]QQA44092.1 twin-arginine translocase subunit TatB [Pelagovum pacificum]TNY32779.1 twin-arginine translocase subunit TatB [Pelagovum pacificum]